MAKTAKLYGDTWRHRLISPSGETVIAPCASTRLVDLDAIGAQHMIKTCHRVGVLYSGIENSCGQVEQKHKRDAGLFQQPCRRWNNRANTGVCSTPPSGVHASPVSTQPYALWRRRPERRRRPDDTLSGGATSSAARTDAPQYGIRPSIRAIRLGACDDLLPHLTAQREADVHVELGVNQCVECGIACVGSHGLQSLRINGVQVRHHRG